MRRKIKTCLLNFFCIILIGNCIGQVISEGINFQFEKIGLHDGLNSNDIRQIYEDSKGYIWICNNLGLQKYNGYEFKNYFSERNIDVTSIIEDQHNNFWIGTEEGLYTLNADNDSLLYVSIDWGEGIKKTGRIQKLDFDTKGNLLVLSESAGLFKLTLPQKKVQILTRPQNESSSFLSFDVETNGNIWILSDDKLICINGSNGLVLKNKELTITELRNFCLYESQLIYSFL